MAEYLTPDKLMERHLTPEILRAQGRIDAFKLELDKNPYYAFDNCDRVLDAAALLQLYRVVQNQVNAGVEIATIYASLQRDLQRGCETPQRSSSPTSNLMHEAKLAGVAKLVETLGYYRLDAPFCAFDGCDQDKFMGTSFCAGHLKEACEEALR